VNVRILITGGAGFIGRRTAAALASRGDEVTLLDNFSPQIHGDEALQKALAADLSQQAEVILGDVRDRDALTKLACRHDAVLHLAAETGTGQSMYDMVRYNDVNVTGTAALLEAVTSPKSHIRKVVVASSRSIYGEGAYRCGVHGLVFPADRSPAALGVGDFDPRCPVCGEQIAVAPTPESAPLTPASVYAVTKLAQENLVLAVAKAHGFAAYGLRYQNVFGAGQSLNNPYTGILSIFSREMLFGRPIEIFEDGLESRDFVHVDDVVQANCVALADTANGIRAINVGTGIGTSVNTVTAELARLLNYKNEIRISGRYRAGDIRHNIADVALLEAELGLRCEISFSTGLEEFVVWARTELERGKDNDGYAKSLAELAQRGLMKGG
jgi:dTDP-L-rhamnose 4-epimerase